MKKTRFLPIAIAILSLFTHLAFAVESQLTRFGPQQFGPDIITPNVSRHAFFGVPGKASLVVSYATPTGQVTLPEDVAIHINGKLVYSLKDAAQQVEEHEVTVDLVETNSIRVETTGLEGRTFSVRVKQLADIDLGITGRIHFNLSTANFDKSREFYRRLGFADALGPFPATNTIEVSRGVGLNEPYFIYAELVHFGKMPEDIDILVPTGRFIDLIEWKYPHKKARAYPNLYRLGINRMVLSSSNLDADMQTLAGYGSRFLSPPATRVDGSRFAITRDPDGTFVELREEREAKPVLANDSYVTGIRNLTINVADFERSRAFYRMLGFTESRALPATESNEVAAAMGLGRPFEVKAELLVHAADGSMIELVEWRQPRDLTPPHGPPINHYGMQRINYATTDLEGDIEKLKAQGVQFLSPIAPCCSGDTSTFGFILFFDPDGNFFQLLGAIEPKSQAQ